jgi:energy-coupling factor transporter ATP-binding protein EcfA2
VNLPGSHPLIVVRDLHYRYENGTAALNGIDFRLDPGESVALLGPNGSGKTTFVLHLNGLLAGSGSIEICGLIPEKKNLSAIRRKVGLVFQDADNQLFMPTVLEDVAFGLQNMGMDPAEAARRAEAALEAAGIAEVAQRAPYHLSAVKRNERPLREYWRWIQRFLFWMNLLHSSIRPRNARWLICYPTYHNQSYW